MCWLHEDEADVVVMSLSRRTGNYRLYAAQGLRRSAYVEAGAAGGRGCAPLRPG